MTIQYYEKSVYGITRSYILNPETAAHVKTLTQNRTITPLHMNALSALGHTFEKVLTPSK